ncbi:PREDICTED: uncharacterized protein LOC108364320 [Rhagoletis zephyria]|uniref:uncharacterized protein LOC108364320 n=1 Tax=Rhagoletis zephyria TaxID=28612 RepID=UPI0008118BFC|nr:PREDICTED: uncharacterized protein LOC108364320 [Rhagoletis zephyria]
MSSPGAIIDSINSISSEIRKQLRDSGNIKREMKNAITGEIVKLMALVPLIEALKVNINSDAGDRNSIETLRSVVREKLAFLKEASLPKIGHVVTNISYSGVVKNQTALQEVGAKPSIVLSATTDPNASHEDVIKAFRTEITFKDTNFAPAKMVKVSNNKVRVEFDDTDQRDITLRKLSNVTNLSAENAKSKRPLVIVKGIPKDVKPNELVETIAMQNSTVCKEINEDGDIKLCFQKENRRNNDIMYNAVLEVTAKVRNAVLSSGRLNIEYMRVNVSDFSNLTQCYKCLQFGHARRKCNSASTFCSHCAENNQYLSK